MPIRSASPLWYTGQRGWNRHPAGMCVGSGASPVRICCSILSCSGTTDSNAFVYGMLRIGQHLLGRADLDDAAEVHHRDTIGDVPRKPEVVGDDEDRRSRVRATARAAVAGSRRAPKRRGRHRLVGDEERGLQHHRAGDHHPLPLPARQLVRVAQEVVARGGRRPQLESASATRCSSLSVMPWMRSPSATIS